MKKKLDHIKNLRHRFVKSGQGQKGARSLSNLLCMALSENFRVDSQKVVVVKKVPWGTVGSSGGRFHKLDGGRG